MAYTDHYLRAATEADLKADQLFFAFRFRADNYQHTFGVFLHPRLKVDAIRPDIDIVTG